jgi:RNA 3'-terminal phosphate cyclase (ATP)
MIRIDGSFGEGGGQILRTSMSLSFATGKAFHIENIPAGRERPGLLRQHLTAVLAAAEVGGADVQGATLGSAELTFSPCKVRPGEYEFSVGTAGSASKTFSHEVRNASAVSFHDNLRAQRARNNMYALVRVRLPSPQGTSSTATTPRRRQSTRRIVYRRKTRNTHRGMNSNRRSASWS